MKRTMMKFTAAFIDNLLHFSSICCVLSRCLRSVSNQRPCCLCSQYLQWSTSTFWQSASVSSIPYFSASSCVLEVRIYSKCFDENADKPTKYCSIALLVQYTFIFIFPAVMFNFILHDQRKGPIWNIIMWTSLFLGHGVIICLYSQEWYAQQYCPIKEVTLQNISVLSGEIFYMILWVLHLELYNELKFHLNYVWEV